MRSKKGKISFDKNTKSAAILKKYQKLLTIRAKSVLSTVFGDIVIPFGGDVWLENLVKLVKPLGINDRLVRTSLYRLSDEDWVSNIREGRRSYYQLTDWGLEETQRAEQLIYYPQHKEWDGLWLFVFLVIKPVDAEAREAFEQELKWLGFGSVARHIWAHPQGSVELLEKRIVKLGLESQVVCMRASNIFHQESGLTLTDTKLAQLCLPMSKVEQEYSDFIDHFTPLYDWLKQNIKNASGEDLTALRILLIDQYRRAVLHDPHLPLSLLPENWVGEKARGLCEMIYRQLWSPTNSFYYSIADSAGKNSNNCNVDPRYESRFQ